MWLVGDGDLLLIGAQAGDVAVPLEDIPSVRKNSGSVLLAEAGVARESASFFLLSLYAGGPGELTSYGGARRSVDDRMDLEFTAARACTRRLMETHPGCERCLIEPSSSRVASVLAAARPDDWDMRGPVALKAEAFGMAHQSFRRAAALDQNVEALGRRGCGCGYAEAGRGDAMAASASARDARDAAPRVRSSYALAMTGAMDAAKAAAAGIKSIRRIRTRRAACVRPRRCRRLRRTAACRGSADDPVSRSRRQPLLPRHVAFPGDRMAEAQEETSRLLSGFPNDARGHNLRGILCAAMKDRSCARSASTRRGG